MRSCRNLFVGAVILAAAASVSSQILDDFEGYADTAELQTVWNHHVTLDTSVVLDGSKSMRLDQYVTPGDVLGAGRLLPGDYSDTIMSVWVRRDSASITPVGNDITVKLFVVSDSGICLSSVTFLFDEQWRMAIFDPNDLVIDDCDPSAADGIVVEASLDYPLSDAHIVVNFDRLNTDFSRPGDGAFHAWSTSTGAQATGGSFRLTSAAGQAGAGPLSGSAHVLDAGFFPAALSKADDSVFSDDFETGTTENWSSAVGSSP